MGVIEKAICHEGLVRNGIGRPTQGKGVGLRDAPIEEKAYAYRALKRCGFKSESVRSLLFLAAWVSLGLLE